MHLLCVHMKNITLSIDEKTLEAGRSYARAHNTTLNSLVRELLTRTVASDAKTSAQELIRLAKTNAGDSKGWQWNRRDLYER